MVLGPSSLTSPTRGEGAWHLARCLVFFLAASSVPVVYVVLPRASSWVMVPGAVSVAVLFSFYAQGLHWCRTQWGAQSYAARMLFSGQAWRASAIALRRAPTIVLRLRIGMLALVTVAWVVGLACGLLRGTEL